MDLYDFSLGDAPLLVSMPHCGTHIPADLAETMTPAALEVADTDFHLPQLYDFLPGRGVSVLSATHSRYVIDLNRPPDGAVLYPGANNTELCPRSRFDFAPIYRNGMEPDVREIDRRVATYWQPYHAKISRELERIKARHGYALLFDAHSIISVCPRFFEGKLTDFNLGTGAGSSCDGVLAERLLSIVQSKRGYTSVLNGRFKGGYITRHYGRPVERVHAVQLELAECTYMHETPPFEFDQSLANGVRPVLAALIDTMLSWQPR
jgi:N-formylglutamate deformylase